MKFQFSTISIAIVVLACTLIDLHFKNWEKQERVIEHDIHSYYSYLPLLFIYDDIKLEKSDYRMGENYYLFWYDYTPDGKKVTRMTSGLSILYAPFFFVAHGFTLLSDYPADGFSEPYKVFLLLSAIFYLIIGLDHLKKTLQYYTFSDFHIAITLLLIGLGTNLFAYASQSAPMSHVYNFCLISVFIYYTIQWYNDRSAKNTIIIGLLFGLITLIRPSNAVIMVFFILYGISGWADFKQRMLLFKRDTFLLNAMFFFAFLVWIPQLIYWKTVTGNYFFDSYQENHFYFNNPKIIDGLFSFRKGWLVYTPIMAFSLIGIFFLRNNLKKLKLSVIVFLLLNIYIIFSWWCWWYGGTFGQRSLIDCYALLAIPFASFVKFLTEKKWYYYLWFYCIAAFFVWLNIFQTLQFEYKSLHWDGMTKELYFKQFGKLARINDFDKLVSWPNYDEAMKGNSCDYFPIITPSIEMKTDSLGRKEESRKRIQLKAANGRFICADASTLSNFLIANKETASTWETFSLIMFDKSDCAILSFNDHYLLTELNGQNAISATGTSVGKRETFIIYRLADNFIALKAANGKYLSLDEKSLQLFANGNTIGEKEKFKLVIEEAIN